MSGFGKRQTVMSKAENRPDMTNLSSFLYFTHLFDPRNYDSLHLLILSNQWEQAYMVGLICYGDKKHTT